MHVQEVTGAVKSFPEPAGGLESRESGGKCCSWCHLCGFECCCHGAETEPSQRSSPEWSGDGGGSEAGRAQELCQDQAARGNKTKGGKDIRGRCDSGE